MHVRVWAQIFETFEDPSFTVFAKIYSLGMMGLIILATACYVLESEAVIKSGGLPASALPIFAQIELVSVVIFSLEYIIRICCCPCEPCPWGLVRFVAAPQNVVDALACIPFWVTFFMKLADPDMEVSALAASCTAASCTAATAATRSLPLGPTVLHDARRGGRIPGGMARLVPPCLCHAASRTTTTIPPVTGAASLP